MSRAHSGKRNPGNKSRIDDWFALVRSGHIASLADFPCLQGALEWKQGQGQTAFLVAARHGHAVAMEWLIKQGANPHATDDNGAGALFHAIDSNASMRVVKLALRHTSNELLNHVYTTSKTDKTVLCMEIVGLAREDCVRALLARGADPNLADAMGLAAHGNREHLLPILLEGGAKIDAPSGPNGHLPLHQACYQDARPALRWLLAVGADPNARNKWNETPLMVAARRSGTMDMEGLVQILLLVSHPTRPEVRSIRVSGRSL